MEVAILLFEGITALDAVGPYEVLSRLPDADVKFVARAPGMKRTDNKMLALSADFQLDECPHPNILVVPGGWGTAEVQKDNLVLDWIREAHRSTLWTASVCTGSHVLAATTGLLKGLQATSHWTAMDQLKEYGAIPSRERIERTGKIVTSAGVSAGIDMALKLVQWIKGDEAAQSIQMSLEYDPQPPFKILYPAS